MHQSQKSGLLMALVLSLLAWLAPAQTVVAPGFEGKFLSLDVSTEHLGVVLDISTSMKRSLPKIQDELRQKLPRTPVLHVDGCSLEKPNPQARVINGVADETVTAVIMLAEKANVTGVLWICDMRDPANVYGIEALNETLEKHGLTLFLLSVAQRPGPGIRNLVDQTEGTWKVVSVVER